MLDPNILFHLLENINKNPLVGLGVVGTNTFIVSCPIESFIFPLFSLVANPTAQIPF